MEGFPILIIILIFWGLIAPLTKAAKKQASQQQKPRMVPRQNAPAAEKKPAAPPQETVNRYSHIAPTISVTEHDDTIYQGSLYAVTGEGTDPCHDEQLSSLSAAEKAAPLPVQEQARLPFGWTGNDIVRGIVMSEILKKKR